MKKKSILLLMIISFFLFTNIHIVSAATCGDIDKEITLYKDIETELSKVDCTKTTDEKTVNTCNDLNLRKSQQISKLYRYTKTNPECTTAINSINTILKENEGNCSLVSDGLIENATTTFMGFFYILGPILLILFGSLDYAKAVVINDPKALKNATNKFVKRLVALLLLFLSPALVNIIINFNNTDILLNGDSYVCGTKYINLRKEYSIKYVPKEESYDTDGGSSSSTSSSKKSSSGTKKGMIAGAHAGYMIRTTKPTPADKHYDGTISNTGQCVWYVRCRANEILNTVKIPEKKRKKAIETINTPVGASAYMFWTNPLYRSVFGSSDDINKPKEGAIIVFGSCPGHQHGHVAMVEKVYKDKKGKVMVDYTEGWASGGNSCPNTNMSCFVWQTRTATIDQIKTNQMGEPFLGYIYLLD